MTRPLVALDKVDRRFPGGASEIVALGSCNLSISDGELVSIVGPSGSGKSTLLNLLGLLDVPSSGDQYFDGKMVSTLSDRDRSLLRGRSIGFVLQDSRLIPHRTAVENVATGLMYGQVRRRDRMSHAINALRQVGLEHRLHALPNTLSGGERQRVAIARALSRRPRLLLADEPTGNLDKNNSAAILDLLVDLNAEGNTIVIVTHDPAVAARCRRQLEMSDGHLAEQYPEQGPLR